MHTAPRRVTPRSRGRSSPCGPSHGVTLQLLLLRSRRMIAPTWRASAPRSGGFVTNLLVPPPSSTGN